MSSPNSLDFYSCCLRITNFSLQKMKHFKIIFRKIQDDFVVKNWSQ